MSLVKDLTLCGMAAAGIALLPAIGAAAGSHQWDYSREARGLLATLEYDATHVSRNAERLQSLTADPNIGKQAHAKLLNQIRAEVNEMGRKLTRLEAIRNSVAPWEQKAIDQAAPAIRLMADNTQDAMHFLNTNPEETWKPIYGKYVTNLFNEASGLGSTVRRYEEYARIHSEDQHMQKALDMQPAS